MAGFALGLLAALPEIPKLVTAIKNGINNKANDPKTKGAAADAATAAINDKPGKPANAKTQKKGQQAADAVTKELTTATQAAIEEAVNKVNQDYSNAQVKLSEQLKTAAGLRPYFYAEDSFFALNEWLARKGSVKPRNPDDLQMVGSWCVAAIDHLKTIKMMRNAIESLEDSERATLLYVVEAIDKGNVDNQIHNCLKEDELKESHVEQLGRIVSSLHPRLELATFAVLDILADLSKGLKDSADKLSKPAAHKPPAGS